MNVKTRYLIGHVARVCGVSVDTIRHYERKGLLPDVERSTSGYRNYPAEAVERVRIVRQALAMGFSLNELSEIFRQRASGRAPCREVRELAGRKLAELDARIEEALTLRDSLLRTLDGWDRQLDDTEESKPVHLLDSLIK